MPAPVRSARGFVTGGDLVRPTRWGAALLTAVLLTALPASYDATRAAGATRPSKGECRVLTFPQIAAESNSTAPVDCTQAHNDRVIKVADLPAGTTWDGLTTKQMTKLGVRECVPAYHKALGQNDRVRDSSAYSWIFFAPTKAQRTGGANWIRCDLILLRGSDLEDLPTDKVPALTSQTLADDERRCATGRRHLTTVCSAPHNYRATGAFTVTGRYPGNSTLGRIALRRCPALVSTPHQFLFTHVSRFTWNHEHDHAVVCLSRRTN